MDQKRDEIRRSIEESRAAMAEKLDMIEQKVERAKRMMDFKYMVGHHPFLVLGGSIVVGFLVGSWGHRRFNSGANRREGVYGVSPESSSGVSPGTSTYNDVDYYSHPTDRSDSMLEQFKDQITVIIKGAALRTAMGLLSEMVKKMMPQQTPASPTATDAPSNSPQAAIGRQTYPVD